MSLAKILISVVKKKKKKIHMHRSALGVYYVLQQAVGVRLERTTCSNTRLLEGFRVTVRYFTVVFSFLNC